MLHRILAALLVAVSPLMAAENDVGVVSNVKVISDKVEDVSTIEAWKKSYIKEGMTDAQKALAIFNSLIRYRHQESPPNEYILEGAHPHDVMKAIHVYGYGQCCCASSNVCQLARHLGLTARGKGISNHSVPEILVGNDWQMIDTSLLTYFPKPDGGVASVDELVASIKEWAAKNPEIATDDAKLRQFMRGEGWKKGPALLAQCAFYDVNGWLPAATHGWYATVQEYNGKNNFVYEYGYLQGYQPNVQLRVGERLTRNWSNKGLHVNGGKLYVAGLKTGTDQLRYTPKNGDIAPGRVGNGTHEYVAPLGSPAFKKALLESENIALQIEDQKAPALHAADAQKPASFTLRMPTSYIYLGGTLEVDAVVPAGGIEVAFSDNNGLDWTPVETIAKSGKAQIDLSARVLRRYDYRLRFTLKGEGAGVNALSLRHDVQHSQRPLPALTEGKNTISVSAGANEGTITIEAGTEKKFKGKNVFYTDFHPTVRGLKDGPLFIESAAGEISFPIATPGDMTRIRTCAHYRCRDAKDGFDVEISFDDGKTFSKIGRLDGPTPGNSKSMSTEAIPAGARKAIVRYSGQQRNTAGIFEIRIDADYREPHGGLAPVKVTYVWEENGAEKRQVHVATKPEETFTIECATKPLMKSLIVERGE